MTVEDNIFVYVKYGKISSYKDAIKSCNINIRNKNGYTLLHQAIVNNQDTICFDLLNRGIDVNAQDHNGQTALHYLGFYMKHWNYELAERIIMGGSDLEIKDARGNTPLWYAVHFSKGNYEFVQLLVNHGANILSKNDVGKTPYDIALRIGDYKLLEIFDDNSLSLDHNS